MSPRILRQLFILGLGLTVIVSALAQAYTAPSNQVIGSANTVTADTHVPVPAGTPCTVQLFSGYLFADFTPKTYTYTPSCPGPWKKVVLRTEFAVTAGRQFDRTAEIWLGGTNIYFGTTAEPSATVARNWKTETDLTDYSALFTSPQNGRVDLGNLVNSTYTGILSGSAALDFYPADKATPVFADLVLPLSGSPTGGTVTLNTGADSLTQTFTLPLNVERAYLDVLTQSQSGDEFWYSCVPNDVAGELQSCGNTAFREAEVSIDGHPAGVAPVYPWIYTGGIDPYLWRPIPGVETLNFTPYRVDLTPFAGILSNGQPHTVSVSVYNANGYFSATATLLLYLDHGSRQVTGELKADDIGAPTPKVVENLTNNNGNVGGSVITTSKRSFHVAGSINTSHGRVYSEVDQTITFSNHQNFTINNTTYIQNISQNTNVSSNSASVEHGQTHSQRTQTSYPLTVDINFSTKPDGTSAQATKIEQALNKYSVYSLNGVPIYWSSFSDKVLPLDTLLFDASGNLTGKTGQSSSQQYQFSDSKGACYNQTIKANSGTLTSVTGGKC